MASCGLFQTQHEALSISCWANFVSHLATGNIPKRETHPEVAID